MSAVPPLAPSPSKPLRWPEMLGYASGDFGFCLYWKVFEFYLLIFYTDTFGISPAQAGTMFVVIRVLDAAIDPFMGMIADRTQTRWGKFRPYLLWFSLPLAGAGILTFVTPNLDQPGKVLWAYCTYGFVMLMYTAANIPYGAMLGVITSDVQKRTTLATLKMVGANAGGTAVTWATIPLVNWLGRGDTGQGWRLTMIIYGAVAFVMLFIAFYSTRERVRPPVDQQTSMTRDAADLLRNGPWMTLFALGLIVILTIAIRNGAGAYLLKYYAGREDLVSWFNTASSLAYLGGAACTPLLTRWFSKKTLFTGLMVVVAVLSALLYLVPPQAIWLMFTINTAISLALGPKSPLTWAMFADSADFGEWKFGRRATALVFAAATFSVKAGAGFAQGVTGWLLSTFGYVANQVQNPEALRGILLLATLIPGGFALLAAVVVRLYSLDNARLQSIQHELESRRLARGET